MRLNLTRKFVLNARSSVFSSMNSVYIYMNRIVIFSILFRECQQEVQLKNFRDHVLENTCAVNLQHIEEYEFIIGLFISKRI